jgi:hypothetical protein
MTIACLTWVRNTNGTSTLPLPFRSFPPLIVVSSDSYASDITCSFPANGKFSEQYRPIYNAVLQAQVTVYNMCKPGTSYLDCHKAAEVSVKLQTLLGLLCTLYDVR